MPTGSVEPEDRRTPCKHQQHQDAPDTRSAQPEREQHCPAHELANEETPRCACGTDRNGEENAQGSGQQGRPQEPPAEGRTHQADATEPDKRSSTAAARGTSTGRGAPNCADSTCRAKSAQPREGGGKETEKGSRPHTDCRAEEHQRTADQAAQNAGDKRDAPPTSRKASRSASLRRDGKPTPRKTTRSTSPRRNTPCGSGTGHGRDHSRSEHPRESDGRARERGRRASRSRSREQHRDMTQKRSRQYIVCTSLGRGSGLKGNELGPTFPSPPSPGLPTPSPSPLALETSSPGSALDALGRPPPTFNRTLLPVAGGTSGSYP